MQRSKELIVKFVKGTVMFLVLCLATYGAFSLLKWSPQPNLNEKDIEYLREIGIYVQDGQAAESGLSAVLGDMDGVEPIGTDLAAPPSSAPPSFMLGTPDASFAPAFGDSAPQFASPYLEQPTPEPFVPARDVLPPPDFPEQVNPPVQTAPPVEMPPFESVPPVDPSPILPTESPPPWQDNWDGPTSDLTRTPPPAEFLVPHDAPPAPVANTLRNIQFPAEEKTVSPTNEGNVHGIDNNVRAIVLVSTSQEDTFSSSDSVPINPTPVQPIPVPPAPVHPVSVHPAPVHPVPVQFSPVLPVSAQSAPVHSVPAPPAPVHPVPAFSAPVRYTPPPTRQSLRFEPVKPESTPNTPSVAFAPPKRSKPQQPEMTTPQESSPPVATHAAVKQIGTPRRIESPAETLQDVQPVIQDARTRFIQMQQQLAESGNPQNIRLAFVQLSKLYEHNQLSEAERTMMLPILDSLALSVIYARDTHILEAPYRVKPGETVESIAQNFNLTPAYLRKVNNLSAPRALTAGTVLKVVVGQFDARISVKRQELTLLLGGLYAGRFSFTVPHAAIPVQRGEFYVTHRTDQSVVLDNGWRLATAQVGDATIVFTDHDADTIFDILSEHSVIVVD